MMRFPLTRWVMWSTASDGHYARGWVESVQRGRTGLVQNGAQALGTISHKGSLRGFSLTVCAGAAFLPG